MAEPIDVQLEEELAAADAVRPEEFDYAIRIRGLVNQFGEAVIHDHLDLDVRSGEILGVVGGHITLFKGLDEMQQLAFSQTLTASDYMLIALVKLAALVLAAACGFRGGRIFPAVFVGVALGLMLHAHVDAVPAAITVSCAILGLTLVVTRDGWLSLFMAAVVVPDSTLLPLLCIVMLPAWLLLAGKPLMIARKRGD